MKEEQLLDAIVGTAQLLGWKVAHFRPAWTGKGYRTAVQGDGAGFPDLVMVHPRQRRLIFAELKAAKGRLSSAQTDWIRALGSVTPVGKAELYVWFPADWKSGEVERCLRGWVPGQPLETH